MGEKVDFYYDLIRRELSNFDAELVREFDRKLLIAPQERFFFF